jgi:uncharacterized protein involved in response to NO
LQHAQASLFSFAVSMSQLEPHGKPTDPYRIFFPLGVLMGIAGVSIWPLYYWEVITWYNGRSHAFVQIDCFVYAFVVGFLWTAIPKFTGAHPPLRATQYAVASLIVAQAAAFELRQFSLGHVLFVVSHVIVIAVAARCFRQRQHPPPETFVLVGLGLLSGLIAAVVNAGIALEWIPPELDLMGRRLMTEGMVLLLVLGVGGFLGPRLLGFAQLPNFQNIGNISGMAKPPLSMAWRGPLYALAGVVLLGSVILEYAWEFRFLAWVRAGIVTALVMWNLRPYRSPLTRTTLAWCVWAAHWLLVAASWLVAAMPKYQIDLLHVMFMGGFTLLILAVGTRVVLSHGGHPLTEEKRSWPLRIGLITGLVALSARVAAGFLPGSSYFGHLAWAAVLWIVGILIWGSFLLKRIRSAPGTR